MKRPLVISASKVLNILLVVGYLSIVALGIKQYSLWQQVLDLDGESAGQLITALHPHALRFLIVLPVFLLARNIGAPQDLVFSLFVTIVFVLSAYYLACAVSTAIWGDNRYRHRYYAGIFLPIALLSMAMNGRIAIAILGLSILVCAISTRIRSPRQSVLKFLFAMLVALLLMAVSSGTIMVGVLSMLFFCGIGVFAHWPKPTRSQISSLWVGIGAVVCFSPFLLVSIDKNVSFFGGGLEGAVNLINHGFGSLLPEASWLMPVFILGASFLAFSALTHLTRIYHRGDVTFPFQLVVLASLGLGIFGYSTLVVAAPAAFALFVVRSAIGPQKAIAQNESPA